MTLPAPIPPAGGRDRGGDDILEIACQLYHASVDLAAQAKELMRKLNCLLAQLPDAEHRIDTERPQKAYTHLLDQANQVHPERTDE